MARGASVGLCTAAGAALVACQTLLALENDAKVVLVHDDASRDGDVTASDGSTPVTTDGGLDAAPSGTIDPTFADGGLFDWSTGEAADIAIQSDGRIVVAARSATASNSFVLRLEPDGTLDPSFGDGGVVAIPHLPARIALQKSGKILVAANALSGPAYPLTMFRLEPDGAMDTGFATDAGASSFGAQPQGLLVDSLDRFVLATSWDGLVDVARFSAEGVPDDGFNPMGLPPLEGTGNADGIAFDLLGNVVACAHDDRGIVLARFVPGVGPTVHDFLIPGVQAVPNGAAVDALGRTLVTGSLDNGNSTELRAMLARFTGIDALEPTFADGGVFSALGRPSRGVVVDGDGRMLIGRPGAVARILTDGQVDPRFGDKGSSPFVGPSGVEGTVRAMALQRDGKLVAGGTFRATSPRLLLVRYLP